MAPSNQPSAAEARFANQRNPGAPSMPHRLQPIVPRPLKA